MLSQVGSIEFQFAKTTGRIHSKQPYTKIDANAKGIISVENNPEYQNEDSSDGEDEFKVTYVDEDEDEFTVPKQFSSKFHPNDSEETTSVTFKSIQKSMLFSKATSNLRKIITKSGKISIKNTHMQVNSHNTNDNKVEAIVEVTDKELKGNVRLQIWGPKVNMKRNKCTVLVTKVEGNDSDLVGKVA